MESNKQEWRKWGYGEEARNRIMKLYLESVREVQRGQPRRMVETFFQVENKAKREGGAVVEAEFVDNQEYYYEECFRGRESCWEGMYVIGDKARQAYMSVFWEWMWFSHFLAVPGWNTALFAHRDDSVKTLLGYIDVFWNGLPACVKAPPHGNNPQGIKASSWRDDHKEIDFGEGVKNRIDVFSAESNTVPRAGRYQCVHFSEGAHYKERYWAEVSGAIAPMQPVWEIWETSRRGTTNPETGTPNQHYMRVQALKNGEIKGHLLQRFWFQDRLNTLPPGSPRAISGSEGAFELTEEEKRLSTRFPTDETPILDRIRWRRSEIRRYVLNNGGNVKRGAAIFQQENLEYESNWSNAEKTPFDVAVVHRYAAAKQLPYEDRTSASGVLVQLLREHILGNSCSAGMDAAMGKQSGNATSVSIVDAGDGTSRIHVARLIGQVSPRVMLDTAIPILSNYENPLFGIESTGGWGESAIQAAKDAHYSRLYQRPMAHGEDPKTYAMNLHYGFSTTQTSKNRILQRLVDDFNSGRFKTYFIDTLHVLENYDPTGSVHTPDELMSLAIANELAGYDSRVWTNRRLAARASMNQQVHIPGRIPVRAHGHSSGWNVWGR